MQTILGSNGQIGYELAKELYKNYTKEIRLVSRNPKQINQTDELVKADLLNYEETKLAVTGSDIVYFTAGLPMNSDMWEEQFVRITENVINACSESKSKLVFFDNTYMYEKNAIPQTETSPFIPVGRKSVVRGKMAELVLDAIADKKIEGVICRAPEFYGPNKTQSITNSMIFERIKTNKKLTVPISDQTLRTLIWTPDASRGMALIGNTPSAYNQTWHLPCDEPITYKEVIEKSEFIINKKLSYSIMSKWQFNLGSVFSKEAKEIKELLPRYEEDNIFLSEKFKKAFPEFKITTFDEGIKKILTT